MPDAPAPRFVAAFDRLMTLEGCVSDHPADPGELTVYGISSRYHPEYFRGGRTPARDDARTFYRREFWRPLQCDGIYSDSVAFEVFEAAVLCGLFNGARFLQEGFNLIRGDPRLAEDGVIGPVTLRVVNDWCRRRPANARALVAAQNYRQAHYLAQHRNPVFMTGWFARRVELGASEE